MAETLAVDVFKVPGEMGLQYSLYYTSPRGWYDNLGYWLDTTCMFSGGSGGGRINPDALSPILGPKTCNQVAFYRPDGSQIIFDGTPGTIGNYSERGGGGLATLTENADFTWTLHDEDGSTQVYSNGGALESIKDTSGIGWTLTHPAGHAGTTVVTATDGQSFSVTKTEATVNGQMIWTVTVIDPAGNHYVYTYTISNRHLIGHNPFALRSLTLPGSPATTISYKYSTSASSTQTLLTEEDYNGSPYFYITYDSEGHAIGSREANDNADYSIVYTVGSGGNTMTAAVTNPLGTKIVKQYEMIDGQYMITSTSTDAVTTCGATTESFAYDSNGLLTRTVDNNGNTHTYSYAANGQLQTETEAAGTSVARTTNYTWDPDQHLNRLLGVAVEGKSKTTYAYTAYNRLASVTQTNLAGVGATNQALTTTYAYTRYADGIVHTMTVTAPSPGGSNHTTFVYDAHGNLTSITDGLGHVTTYSGYNALGEAGKVVGPNGAEVDYTYDARGRVATKTTHPNGGTATWAYVYDGFGKLAKLTAPDGEVTTWARDASMRVTSITHNDKDGTSTEAISYDALGDVTADVIKRGSDVARSAAFTYDGLGRLYQAKGANGQKLTYAYDGNGNVLSVTDALGRKTSYTYDALNRVTSVANAAGGLIRFAYDAGDHVVKVTDPRGLVTTYRYDGFGHLWDQVSPDTGTTTQYWGTYGRLDYSTRADGVTATYRYDPLNRLTSVVVGGQTHTYTWDNCTNGKGRLCEAAVSGQSSVDYSYTPQGQVAARAFSIANGPVYGMGYSYNAMGQLAQVAYPDGNEATYDYDLGVVKDVRLKVGSSTVSGITGVGYRPMDLAMTGWTTYNGLIHTLAYDDNNRLTSISVPGVESLAFSYDAANRITHIADGINGNHSEALSYDALGRLTGLTAAGVADSYGYDADGNRIQLVTNGATTSYHYASDSNHLTAMTGAATASYGYSANGNIASINGTTAYAYDPFDHLAHAGGMTYLTSAEGQRLEKAGGGHVTYFAPTGGALLAEDRDGAWTDYVWLNGRLAEVIANGRVYSVASDQTGRPIALTAPDSHAVVWSAWGLPFSRNITANGFGTFNLGFPGQYFDSETGLWHNGARDYNHSLGRFLESDPIGLAGGVNTYAYVGNDPLDYIDPLGLCCSKAQKAAAEAAKALSKASGAFSDAELGAGGVAAGSAIYGGFVGEADLPITAVSAETAETAGAFSNGTGLVAAGLNTYASGGNFGYFVKFSVDNALRMVNSRALSHVPGMDHFAKFYSGLTTRLLGSFIPDSLPCGEQ